MDAGVGCGSTQSGPPRRVEHERQAPTGTRIDEGHKVDAGRWAKNGHMSEHPLVAHLLDDVASVWAARPAPAGDSCAGAGGSRAYALLHCASGGFDSSIARDVPKPPDLADSNHHDLFRSRISLSQARLGPAGVSRVSIKTGCQSQRFRAMAYPRFPGPEVGARS